MCFEDAAGWQWGKGGYNHMGDTLTALTTRFTVLQDSVCGVRGREPLEE